MVRFAGVFAGLVCAAMWATTSLQAQVIIGGDRPTTLHVPASYDPEVPAPLVLLLHGCPSDAAAPYGENVLKFGPVAEERGLLFAAPDGSGAPGRRSWGACSGSFSESSRYLRSLIEEVQERFNVDPGRIYVAGYSDGSQMSFRMAADHPDLVAAIATLFGGFPRDQVLEGEDRELTVPVPFLNVYGTADEFYDLAVQELDAFVRDTAGEFVREEIGRGPDLVARVETSVSRWGVGCLPEGYFELWTLPRVNHFPVFIPDGATNAAGRNMIDWLLRHPRGPAPTAVIQGVPPLGVVPLEVTADASESTAPPGATLRSYCWSFSGRAATGVTASHRYDVPGRHFARLLVISDQESVSSKVEQAVTVTCPDGDLGPWTGTQVGETVLPGAARFEGAVNDSDFLLCGGGGGFLRSGDSFFFVHREVEGDFRMTVRVEEMSGDLTQSSVALMIRSDLGETSPFAAAQLRLEGAPSAPVGRFLFRYRLPDDSARVRPGSTERTDTPTGWMRIERRGDLVRAEVSTDNIEWTLLREQQVSELGSTPLVGLAAMNTSAETIRYFETLQARVAIESIESIEGSSPIFRRGDCNGDGTVEISDALCIFEWLFSLGREPGCVAATNTNGDEAADISDATFLLNYLFSGGPAPSAPFPDCGPGTLPAGQTLGCVNPPACL